MYGRAPQADGADPEELHVHQVEHHGRAGGRHRQPGAVDPARAARQAQGVVSAVMATAHTTPRTASGTPKTTDHELVVTNVQLTMPVSGQANAVGSV